jgi:hypothetical protein
VVEIASTHRFRQVLTVLLSRIETGFPMEKPISKRPAVIDLQIHESAILNDHNKISQRR